MSIRLYDWLYKIIRTFGIPIRWVFGTHDELAELVESGRLEPGRALDIGCGAGREAIYLAEHGFEVTGVDISPTAIEMARKSAESLGVEARFVVGDVTQPGSAGGPFDLIVDYGCMNDLAPAQRDAYLANVLPLAAKRSHFVLMCFDKKLDQTEVRDRFADFDDIERVSLKGEARTGRAIATYLMEKT